MTLLYILRCSDRSYLVRYTIILITSLIVITSRDRNHITWFRNSAFVSLFATLSHRTWIGNDFSLFQLFQKRSKVSDCIFWKFSYKRKFSFLFIFCTRNRHSTMIENYIRKNDVIRCEFDLTLIEKTDSLFDSHKWLSRSCDRLSQIVIARTLIDFHRLLSRDIDNLHRLLTRKRFVETIVIRFLKRRETEQICLWLMILSNRQLSFDR
jgi:hypothetical protein